MRLSIPYFLSALASSSDTRTHRFFQRCVGLLVFIVCFETAFSQEITVSPAISPREVLFNQFDQYVQAEIKRHKVPGCAIAVIYKDKTLFMKGYGVRNLAKKDKITPDTVFQLGSVSKPVSSTLAAILAKNGLLDLDAPVSHYLPKFSLQGSLVPKTLKVKTILAHASGVPRQGFNNMIEAHRPYRHIVKRLQTTPLQCPVGRCYDYHNAMFGLLSDIIHRATYRSFGESLQRHLLRPLNMQQTTTSFHGLITRSDKAVPHVKDGKARMVPLAKYSKGYYAVVPSGGINSSVRDMATFLKLHAGAYPHIIDRQGLEILHRPHIETKSVSAWSLLAQKGVKKAYYGLGWRIVDVGGERMVFHGGWLKGFTNVVAFLPRRGVGIVVLQNAENKFSFKTALKFFDLYLSASKALQKEQGESVRTVVAKAPRTPSVLRSTKGLKAPRIIRVTRGIKKGTVSTEKRRVYFRD